MTYNEWMEKVDSYLLGKVGLTSSDLADGPSRGAYDGGDSPEDYANELLEDNGYPLDDED